MAKDAIQSQGTSVTGGWTDKSKDSGIYRGGVFEHEGNAGQHALASNVPAAQGFWTQRPVSCRGQTRKRWLCSSLGIVWALVTPELTVPSASLAPLPAIDADFADEIRRVILTSVTNDWFAAKNSRAAEAVVAPVLHPALQTRGYVGRSPRFASYWRNGITDGAWQHEPGNPRRITLEVKVNEDTDALRPNYRRPLTPSSHRLTPPGEVAGAPGRIGRG